MFMKVLSFSTKFQYNCMFDYHQKCVILNFRNTILKWIWLTWSWGLSCCQTCTNLHPLMATQILDSIVWPIGYRCSKTNQNVKYNTCPAPFCWSWFHLGQSSSSSWQSRPPPCTCGRQRTRWRWRRSGWRRARRRWPALRSPSPSRCRTLQGSHRPGSQGEAKSPQDTPLPL